VQLLLVAVSLPARSDPVFLYRILGEVIKAGATTLNIPDTVGYTMPTEFGALIAGIKEHTPGVENVIISTHCQNDLGLATANTLAVSAHGRAHSTSPNVPPDDRYSDCKT